MTTTDLKSFFERSRARAEKGHAPSWKPSTDPQAPNPIGGKVIGWSTASTREDREYEVVTIQQDDGSEFAIWLMHFGIKDALERDRPNLGDLVYIEYRGRKTNPNTEREYHDYAVIVEHVNQKPF